MMIKFGDTIIYTENVEESIGFFEKAFGLQRGFIHQNDYGELATGETKLAFASHEIGKTNLSKGYLRVDNELPLGIEIALVVDDVQKTFDKAISVGASRIEEPQKKPWGQVIAYIRCPDGTLVELCTPMGD